MSSSLGLSVCSVINCSSTQEDGPLYRFPRRKEDPHRFSLWWKATGRGSFPAEKEKINRLSLSICYKHFPKQDISEKRLRYKSVPTLNLPTNTSSYDVQTVCKDIDAAPMFKKDCTMMIPLPDESLHRQYSFSGFSSWLHDMYSDEAKAMWIKLRTGYRDALRRQRNCLKNGAASSNVKPWRFQKEMSFFARHITNRSREGTITSEQSDEKSQNGYQNVKSVTGDHDKEQTNTNEDVESADKDVGSPNKNVESEVILTYSEESSYRTEYQLLSLGGKKLKNNKDDIATLLTRTMQQREERTLLRREKRNKIDEHHLHDDPLYNFFLSMYQSTKKLPSIYKYKIKSKLLNSVLEAEAEVLKDNS